MLEVENAWRNAWYPQLWHLLFEAAVTPNMDDVIGSDIKKSLKLICLDEHYFDCTNLWKGLAM